MAENSFNSTNSSPGLKISRSIYLAAVGIAFLIVGLLGVISFKDERLYGAIAFVIGILLCLPIYRDFRGPKVKDDQSKS